MRAGSKTMSGWGRFRKKYKNEMTAYAILAIPLLIWGVFFLYAFCNVIVYSFTDWGLSADTQFIGFENYIRALHDERVLKGMLNTLIWTVTMMIGVNGFGLLVAFLIAKIRRGWLAKLVLAMLFWPTLVSAAASAEIQEFLLDPNSSGLLNWFLLKLGLIKEPIGWLIYPDTALIGLMIMPFFLGFGTRMIIFYAGIKNIPSQYYEAARLETDRTGYVFWHITFPLLRQVLVLNLVLSLIEGFKVLAPMQLITNGDPLNSTMSVTLALYKYGFEENEMGYASAIGILLFAVILVFTILQLKLDKEKVSYE